MGVEPRSKGRCEGADHVDGRVDEDHTAAAKPIR